MLKEILAAGAAHCPEDASADSQDITYGQGFLQTFHDCIPRFKKMISYAVHVLSCFLKAQDENYCVQLSAIRKLTANLL